VGRPQASRSREFEEAESELKKGFLRLGVFGQMMMTLSAPFPETEEPGLNQEKKNLQASRE